MGGRWFRLGGEVAVATTLLVATQGVVGGSEVRAGAVLADRHLNDEGMEDGEGGGRSGGERESVGRGELHAVGVRRRSTSWSMRGLKGAVSLAARVT